MRVGVAGIGKMGAAIAARLQEQGDSLTVWNRSPANARATGLKVADSPLHLAQNCEVIISSLFDEAALEAVYHGDRGLIAGAHGKLFVEMSTVRPGFQQSLAKSVAEAGGSFIECPVGGTTGPARSGELLGLVGGAAEDLERARPLLNKLCRRIEHMGPVGSGALAKLAINLPLLVFWQSLGEALALVRDLRKEPDWVVQLFSEIPGGANVLRSKACAVAAALAGDQSVPATFNINAMRKDLQMIRDEAQMRSLALPVTTQALSALDAAIEAGLGSRDCAYAPAYWASRRGDASDVELV